jgi:hypothetical protein
MKTDTHSNDLSGLVMKLRQTGMSVLHFIGGGRFLLVFSQTKRDG